MNIFRFILFLVFISIPLFSQSEKYVPILISKPIPYNSEYSTSLEQRIIENIESTFSKKGIRAIFTKSSSPLELSKDEQNKTTLFLKIYYQKKKGGIVTIYNVLYDTKEKVVIDALHNSNDILEILGEDFKDAAEKYKEPEDSLVQKNAENLAALILSNPNSTINRENIFDHLISKPIGKSIDFSMKKEDKDTSSKEILKEFEMEVITASRKSQKISEAPSKVIVFSREMIRERGYRTLTDLLQDVPGFDFNSFYDSGEYPTDLILRGISDVGQSQILVMENGIIQNDIGNGWLRHVQFDTVFIDIDRIEIILGPGSSLYGANAYAGLINIITKTGKNLKDQKINTASGEGRIQAGKYNTTLTEGLLSYKFANEMVFQMSGRHYKTNGDRGVNRPDPGNYFSNNFEPTTVQTSEYGIVQNDRTPLGTTKPISNGFNNSADNFFVRGSLYKDGLTIGFNLWDLREGLGTYVPSYEYFTNTKGIPYQKHHRGFFVHASYETEITKKLNSTSKVYYRNTTIMPDTGFVYTYRYQSLDFPVSNNGQALPPVTNKAKQYHGPSTLVGAQQQFNYDLLSNNHLVLGIQLDRFTRQSISDGVGGVSLGRTQNTNSNIVESTWESEKQSIATIFYSHTIAGYIQDEHKIWNDKLSFTLGVRNDRDSDYGNILTKRAAVIAKPWAIYNAKLLYGEAFKAPTVFQLYDEFRGNRELEPQKIKTSEIENSFFLLPNLNLKAGYFMSQLSGLIAEGRNPDLNAPAARSTIFQNFRATHIYGFTFEVDYSFNKILKIFGNYSITRDRDRKTEYEFIADRSGSITAITPIYDGKEIDNIAERKFNVGANINLNKFNVLNIRVNWVGRRKAPITNKYFQPYDFSFIQNRYPYQTQGQADGYLSGYSLLHATWTHRELFNISGLELQVIGRNLLNKSFLGMGRQSGNAVRPTDSYQPLIRNPEGFVSPYHPQPGREIFIQLGYHF
jgi:outer membrane receptor for ferrienterochelin and colicins